MGRSAIVLQSGAARGSDHVMPSTDILHLGRSRSDRQLILKCQRPISSIMPSIMTEYAGSHGQANGRSSSSALRLWCGNGPRCKAKVGAV